ncbi:prokaryotic type I DNA topoisomerase [Ascobolus immersus RN42]|uniref:DNA topoisomerase n=1 Tax=Ascobolus immersus RN42 TaxID=1160509 RepID=A0A3N4I7M5_ASCIM|nr:prokaryotic type I DNA topoisomerase [Ascobolus immersus RN42]
MPKILCIAEKPSIAKAVAGILSGHTAQVKSTASKYTKNYEFNFDFGPPWGKSQVVMSSVAGHTTSYDLPKEYGAWANYPCSIPFEAPCEITIDDDKKAIAANIARNAKYSQVLYIWTDCDREGEYIGTEVRDIARKENPRIQVKRANFNNLEPNHIIRAACNPVDLDERQAAAVAARIELDLRIGAAFTRLQTLKLRSIHGIDPKKVISYGSCQFPCLGFIVDRYHKITRFVTERFWSIKVTHVRDNVPVVFNWARNRLFDRMAVTLLFEQCLTAKKARITKVDQKPTRKFKPLPLTTIELQKKGSSYLHMSSDAVMKTAEALYQKGFISYPRTETDQFDKGMDLRGLVQKQTQHTTWGQYAQGLMDGGFSQPRDGKNNDKAHPPIHPVICAQPNALSLDEKRVYEFVTRRFLACCSSDAVGSTTTLTLLWGNETFSASGLTVLERNFLDVYPYERWTTNELPLFREGEEFEPTEAQIMEGKTSPPTFITEPELIGLMDANGIGTDATMAEHIKTVIDREYVFAKERGGGGGNAAPATRGRGRGRGRGTRGGAAAAGGEGGGGGTGVREFVPSTLGLGLVEGYDDMKFDVNLSKPFLRKEMEVKMKQICEGQKTREEVVRESLAMYREVFDKAEQQIAVLRRVNSIILNLRRLLTFD